jgi:multiple sugar transport system permease protein
VTIPSLRDVTTEAKLLLIGIPVFLWTMLPLYHLFLFAISAKDSAFAGKLWPDHPTLRNFEIVFAEKHYFLNHFWLQLWNSTVIAVAIAVLTLLVATGAALAISRLRCRAAVVMNLALFTYFIPAAFLAVPMYKTMGNYGLLNNQWSLILAMVTVASPMRSGCLSRHPTSCPSSSTGGDHRRGLAAATLPPRLSAADDAVARGSRHYALLLAWNEYLYAFLLLSRIPTSRLPVASAISPFGRRLPWELLMTTASSMLCRRPRSITRSNATWFRG